MPKFFLDAQLPRRLVHLFLEFGFPTSHTLDLPDGNRSSDVSVLDICREEDRILVTKDNDFVESYLIIHRPDQLLFLSCGNLTNPMLEQLLRKNLVRIAREFSFHSFIELTREDIIIHS